MKSSYVSEEAQMRVPVTPLATKLPFGKLRLGSATSSDLGFAVWKSINNISVPAITIKESHRIPLDFISASRSDEVKAS
jgi:hypothetical protein